MSADVLQQVRAELRAALLAGKSTETIRARMRQLEQDERAAQEQAVEKAERRAAEEAVAISAAAVALAAQSRARITAGLAPFDDE
jgi:hypothetical protein